MTRRCHCGCGAPVKPGRDWVNAGHYWRGRLRPPFSKQHRQNIGAAGKGRKSPFKGKSVEIPWIAKLSASRRGVRNPMYGKNRERHHNWRGGTTWSHGYLLRKDRAHPNANKDGYVFDHVVVITRHLRRPLKRGELIHHINGKKADNRLSNLWLCAAGQHRSAHHSLFELVAELLDRKIVRFDRKLGKYVLR